MGSIFYRPRPPLDRFIEFFWSSPRYVAETARERVLPAAAYSLIMHLSETPLRTYADEGANTSSDTFGAIVVGPRSTPLIIGTAIGETVGVHFKPGGARAFFDMTSSALAEETAPLEALWGNASRTLRERILEAKTRLDRVHHLEDFLLEKTRASLELNPALCESLSAFDEPDLRSVAEVNRRTGLSPKRLLSLFREQVGLSPKAFWRVRRFRAALDDLGRGVLRGAALAAKHGYFDQAHFVREFRAFAGSTPGEYLAARVRNSDHVAVRGKKDPIPAPAPLLYSEHELERTFD